MKAPKICSFLRRTYLYLLAAPVLAIVLGAASNQAVLIANHDTFPVMVNQARLQSLEAKQQMMREIIAAITGEKPIEPPAGMIDDVHCVMTSKTHLNALADIFDMRDAIYSIGDFSIMFGEWSLGFAPFVFVFAVARKLNEKE